MYRIVTITKDGQYTDLFRDNPEDIAQVKHILKTDNTSFAILYWETRNEEQKLSWEYCGIKF
jgi:hypothetical protein